MTSVPLSVRFIAFSSPAIAQRPNLSRVRRAFWLSLIVATATWVAPAWAGGRVALVLAAEDYQPLAKSPIGVKRASDIADALKAKGFDVILTANPSNAGARAGLRDFSVKVADADIAIAVLVGHTTSAGGQSFFLPVNTEISAATDLFSRGLSVTNVAQITGRAKAGAVLVLMSVPAFPTPVEGIDARPQFNAEIGKSVVTAFSSSTKVPVSRVDALSSQDAETLAKVLQKPAATLADLVAVFASEGGLVVGTAQDVSLDKPAPAKLPETAALTGDSSAELQKKAEADQQRKVEAERQLEAERVARAEAERRVKAEQAKATSAEKDLAAAQDEAKRARLEAEKAKAEAERAQAEAEKAKSLAEAEKARVLAQAETEKVKLLAQQAEASSKVASLQPAGGPAQILDEKQLGQRQRQRIQERLRAMTLYTGPIDSIMGPLTREAIMGFQRGRSEPVTGYLTPEQFQALLPNGE